VPLLDPKGEYIQEHWRNRVLPMAAERGLSMRIPPVQTRTRRAHETAAFARAHGTFGEVDRALYRAFFEEGLDIADAGLLEAIVRKAGLDGDAWRRALDTGEFADSVRGDLQLALQLGITSVPTLLVADESGRAEPVVGAVPYERLEDAIQRTFARSKNHAKSHVSD
jgi:predicted DsbA family dithiol-disulfide isomerase